MVKEIPLTQGKIALIDDDDYEKVNQYKWYAVKKNRTCYAVRAIYNKQTQKIKQQRMHRFIMNAPEGIEVDHREHPGTNNQKHNLRLATRKQNGANQRKFLLNKYGKPPTSKYKGVKFKKGAWEVQIFSNEKTIYLGRFKDEIEAAKTYDKKAIELFGEFACLNFPQPSPVP